MSTNLKQKVIFVNSSKKTSGMSSSFAVDVNLPFNNTFNRCSVSNIEIPKSYYMINTGVNDTLGLSEDTGPVGEVVTLAAGNYTTSTLATELKTKLDAASVTGGNSFTYTVTFSEVTGLFTISKTGTGEFDIVIGHTSIGKYLGLPSGLTSSVSNTLSSTKVVNLQRYDVLYVNSDNVKNNNDSVLYEVLPGTYPSFSVIKEVTEDLEGNSVALLQNNVTSMNFTITDEDGGVVDLNGVDVRMKITFYCDLLTLN